MARWASLVDAKRSERPVLLVDTGDMYPPQEMEHEEIMDRYFFWAMKLLRYDAVGVGEHETRVGLDRLSEIARGTHVPFVSSNILDRAHRKPIAATSIVKCIGGKRGLFARKGCATIGIFSVVLPGYVYEFGMDVARRYVVLDAKEAARETANRLRAEGCDLIVALSHETWEKSLELAKEVPGIDIVLSAHGSHPLTYGERVGSTTVIDPGEKEHSFTEVDVTFGEDSVGVKATEICSTALQSPGDMRFLELEKRYNEEIRRLEFPPRTEKTKP